MKKYILDLTVTENIRLHANYVLIKLTQSAPLPDMLPGQFAEIRIDGSNTTFLRRPISINYVDRKTNEVWFLVQLVGDGTRKLATESSANPNPPNSLLSVFNTTWYSPRGTRKP